MAVDKGREGTKKVDGESQFQSDKNRLYAHGHPPAASAPPVQPAYAPQQGYPQQPTYAQYAQYAPQSAAPIQQYQPAGQQPQPTRVIVVQRHRDTPSSGLGNALASLSPSGPGYYGPAMTGNYDAAGGAQVGVAANHLVVAVDGRIINAAGHAAHAVAGAGAEVVNAAGNAVSAVDGQVVAAAGTAARGVAGAANAASSDFAQACGPVIQCVTTDCGDATAYVYGAICAGTTLCVKGVVLVGTALIAAGGGAIAAAEKDAKAHPAAVALLAVGAAALIGCGVYAKFCRKPQQQQTTAAGQQPPATGRPQQSAGSHVAASRATPGATAPEALTADTRGGSRVRSAV